MMNLVKVAIVGFTAAVCVGCGVDASQSSAENGPRDTSETTTIGTGERLSIPYTIEVGDDPLCATISVNSEPEIYTCSLDEWRASAISLDTIGSRQLEIYFLPAEATDVLMTPSYVYELSGRYLLVERDVSDPPPSLEYLIDNRRITCDLAVIATKCSGL